MPTTKPRNGNPAGYPAGIGPKLIPKQRADAHIFAAGQAVAGAGCHRWRLMRARSALGALPALYIIAVEQMRVARLSKAGVRSVLRGRDAALGLPQAGVIDAIVLDPIKPAALIRQASPMTMICSTWPSVWASEVSLTPHADNGGIPYARKSTS